MNANLGVKSGKSALLYNSALVASKEVKTTPKLNIMLNDSQAEQSYNNNVTIKTQDRHNEVKNHTQ